MDFQLDRIINVMTLTREQAQESKEMESLRVHADALLSLSSPAGGGGDPSSTPAGRRALAAEGVFECKTCRKRFTSFQALGGHRTSHTRLQARMLQHDAAAAADGHAEDRDNSGMARVHECAVCGLEFSMGQALGGHMRRHRGEAAAPSAGPAGSGSGSGSGAAQLDGRPDLNYPPMEDAGDGQGSTADGADHTSELRLLNLLV